MMVARTHLHHTTSARSFSSSSSQGQSRGALAGGFSKENFAGWAQREWGEVDTSNNKEPDHYIDLFSAKVSGPCAAIAELDLQIQLRIKDLRTQTLSLTLYPDLDHELVWSSRLFYSS